MFNKSLASKKLLIVNFNPNIFACKPSIGDYFIPGHMGEA